MVKVLSRGRRAKDEPLQATCGKCGSLLGFTRQEARREPDLGGGDALVIDCPECGTEVWTIVPAEQGEAA